MQQQLTRGCFMAEHRGGSGNFADDKKKASDAGKKGGEKAAVVSKTIPLKRQKQARKAVRSSHQRCK
jgi:general stress protein YciG